MLLMTAGWLSADNLQVSFANLVNGSKIQDCTEFTVTLNVSVENTDIYDVRVYANGVQFARIRNEPWQAEWTNLVSGYYKVWAKATDDDKNVVYSDTIIVIAGDVDEGNLALNSNFNCSTFKWSIQNNSGAQGTLEWEADAGISDGGAAFVDLATAGTENWHVQMLQSFPIDSAHVYEISLIAETPAPKDIQWAMQENAGDFEYYNGEVFTVEGNNFYGPFEFIAPRTDPTNAFKLFLGIDSTPIYFDDIMIIDRSVTFPELTGVDQEASGPEHFVMIDNYPNPFNGATVINYQVTESSDITLRIMNIRGELVRTLVNTHVQPGAHKVQWDGTDASGAAMTSGTYIAQLSAASGGITRIRTTKLMLVE